MEIQLRVQPPRVPNYIILEGAGTDAKISITDVTDEALNEFADTYKAELFKRRDEIRNLPYGHRFFT